ncbi:hypothetical protein Q3G72_003785 [Acer saccharum]|nr:hypothetical protein Q3G72_003785 [Acer saccharum]
MPSDGIEAVLCFLGGYRGFYAQNTLPWTPKHSEKLTQHIDFKSSDITLLRFTFGGDGTLVSEVFEEIRRCGLKVTVAGIPKTIDNALQYFSCHVIDKSFGFGTVVEEANELLMQHTMKQKALIIVLNHSCISKVLVIIIAEGAGQDLLTECMRTMDQQDAWGNNLLRDVDLWISQKIKEHFSKWQNMAIKLKYTDPKYMVLAIPSNASDNVYCILLAHSAILVDMAGYTGFTVGPVNGKHAYIPIHVVFMLISLGADL